MIASRAFGAVAALAMITACTQPDEGALQAQPGPGVTIGKRSTAGDTAEIALAGIRARIWGDWGSDAGETIDIEYRNTGSTPVSVPVDRIRISFDGYQGAVQQISDVSRVDLDDADHRNDLGRSLMEDAEAPDQAGILAIPAGAVRRVQVSFLPFPEPRRARLDDIVALSVPLSDAVISVPFKLVGP